MSTLAVNTITDANSGNTATINSYTPTESNMAGRNRIINGDMRIDQRNAGAAVTPAASTYTLDRFRLFGTVGSKLSIQQVVDAPAGFTYSAKITVASSYSPSSSEQFFFGTTFEADNIGDLAFGTASAKTATLSFWVKSSVTGTYSASWTNNANDRSYVQTFTIASADTWEQKTITIVGDTTGTWTNYGNTRNSFLQISLGAGSNFYGTAGSWQSGNLRQTSGSTNFVSQANNSTFYITGVQLEVGSVATPFERRPYTTELQLCQRYFLKNLPGATDYPFTNAAIFSTTLAFGVYAFPVTMRATPSVSFNSANDLRLLYNGTGQNSSAATGSNGTPSAIELLGTYSGLTAGQAAWMRAAGSASFVAFSAEL